VVHEVLLYKRRHCGLCDEAAIALKALASDLDLEFAERDIDGDPALRERYDAVIPVVAIDGRVVVQAPFTAEELREIVVEALQRGDTEGR
jgi:thiol-disulfide isomerase/thioredoxin